jgi:predicted nucleic acid-binding protein
MPAQSDKTFSLTAPIDMLVKLEWEWEKMRGFDITKYSYEKTYYTINAALTAWHMCDWLDNTLTVDQRAKLSTIAGTEIKNHKAIQELVKGRSRALVICDQVANAAKHLLIKDRPDPYTAAERQLPLRDGQTTYYLMAEDDTSRQSMDAVIGFALAYWKELFVATGLATHAELNYPLVERYWAAKPKEIEFWSTHVYPPTGG